MFEFTVKLVANSVLVFILSMVTYHTVLTFYMLFRQMYRQIKEQIKLKEVKSSKFDV